MLVEIMNNSLLNSKVRTDAFILYRHFMKEVYKKGELAARARTI